MKFLKRNKDVEPIRKVKSYHIRAGRKRFFFFSKKGKKSKNEASAFGQAEDVEALWSLSKDDAYVEPRRKGRLPRFVIPAFVFLFSVIMIFWLLPGIVARMSSSGNEAKTNETEPVRLYTTTTRVVDVYATSLMQEPSITSARITQILYNEPVTLLDETEQGGFVLIETQDFIKGYVKAADLTDHLDSVEPNLHMLKLVVSDMSRNVKSQANNGTLLAEVMMNTVLYADEKGDGVYKVLLPGGIEGWIGSSGVIELGVNDKVGITGVRYFVSSVLSFLNITQLDHGLTKRGLSVEGLAYISANVNGVELPRRMEEQAAFGQAVDLVFNEVTGMLEVDSIKPGDLVFFSKPSEPDSDIPYEMGICTSSDMVIMASATGTTLRLVNLSQNTSLLGRVVTARRIFK